MIYTVSTAITKKNSRFTPKFDDPHRASHFLQTFVCIPLLDTKVYFMRKYMHKPACINRKELCTVGLYSRYLDLFKISKCINIIPLLTSVTDWDYVL